MMKNKNNNVNALESCFFCSESYSQDDFLMLEKEEQRTTFHITCRKCNTSSIIFMSITSLGVVSLGVATDLDRDEVTKIFRKEAINADDILEIHQIVSGKDSKLTKE